MDIYSITNGEGETLSRTEINNLLQEMGISDEAIEKGSDAIAAEAEQDGIRNLDEKLVKKAKESGISGASDNAKQDYEATLKTLGIPVEIIDKGNAAIQTYAEENSINLPKAAGTSLNLKF